MTRIHLGGADAHVMFSHMALYGLAAILEDSGAVQVRLGWTTSMNPVGFIESALSQDEVAEVVHAHALARNQSSSWVQADIDLKGTARGLMSPRLSAFGQDRQLWKVVQTRRHAQLDTQTESLSRLDLRLMASLGEPAYWSFNRQGQNLPDNGASRLEMQPRNQGSEFVGSRLRKLAESVARRDAGSVRSGLAGLTVEDEIGGNAVSSRTPTGFASPGPVDNALAWCALWGISQLPLLQKALGSSPAAVTSGHIGQRRSEWFYLPIWQGLLRPAQLRSILVGRQLYSAATRGLTLRRPVSAAELVSAQAWLTARSVIAVVRFPIEQFGSASAPERRAMRGEILTLAAT